MSQEEQQFRNLLPPETETALQYVKQRLSETISFLGTLASAYSSMASAANQLSANAFSHRSEIDEAVERTVKTGEIIDKLLKLLKLLVNEYQTLVLLDQAEFAKNFLDDDT
ncbi:MAG: hypothetical protein ACOY3H_02920 [Bacillota bacterium]|uniref:Uncharacterized protein n=2 Tax=Carboxydocella TaxID=178898 RepID=A0A1T4QYW9_9FIRM|nr:MULTISPECIES: hypothetical protein [Carboxydocella]AVX19781.1 hypothetical protein CFE_0582 [Carboxydocella thermautotrophica]AVX30190.1 hypothetical protein CTH_0587 [Carboxydocella thermautotrophica]SKA08845.1 hypothetical protein SAMN02745885_01855 [Carboxydocella sporoproducens DSM 16521]GAW28587.1 hypothetical protein ULO1_11570 [Carboxydocella sp. ULO1]GAW30675.1 hypothetical protein JDF658_04400 [Carboxydocella sp. JDF658]